MISAKSRAARSTIRWSALATLLWSIGCGTGAEDPAEVKSAATIGKPRYFSWYASAMTGEWRPSPGEDGTFTREISDHANTAWVAGAAPGVELGAGICDKIQEAKDLGMGSVVDVSAFFFGRDEATRKSYVLDDGASRFAGFAAQLRARDLVGAVVAFYPLDEPLGKFQRGRYTRASWREALEGVNALIAAELPGIPRAAIFSGDDLFPANFHPSYFPTNYDWVGLDYYGCFDNCGGVSIPELFAALRSVYRPHRSSTQLIAVPDAHMSSYSGSVEEVVQRASQWRSFVNTEGSFVLVAPFIYQAFTSRSGQVYRGAVRFPEIRRTYAAWGRCLSNPSCRR